MDSTVGVLFFCLSFKLFLCLQRCFKCSVAVHKLLPILEAAWLQQCVAQDQFAYAVQPGAQKLLAQQGKTDMEIPVNFHTWQKYGT